MPGLLRGLARTAIVAGTASAVAGRVQRHQARKFVDSDAQIAADRERSYEDQLSPQDEEAEAAPAPPAPPAPGEMIEQLKQLAELKDQGILTEEEFATQKARILA